MINYPPIFGPLIQLLRSRKFIVAIVAVLIDVVIVFVPSLEVVRTELLAVVTALASMLIGSIAYEDGQEKSAGNGLEKQ